MHFNPIILNELRLSLLLNGLSKLANFTFILSLHYSNLKTTSLWLVSLELLSEVHEHLFFLINPRDEVWMNLRFDLPCG